MSILKRKRRKSHPSDKDLPQILTVEEESAEAFFAAGGGMQAPEPGLARPPKVLVGEYSVAGHRNRNEDYYLCDADRRLWVVSDGIGGAPFGDVMSRIACNATPSAWEASRELVDMRERMVDVIARVDKTVSAVSVLLGNEGSGATYLLAAFVGNAIWLASVGDTRAFLVRDMQMSGLGGEGHAVAHSNALEAALGYKLALTPNVATIEPQVGDVVVLCSDGVWSTQTEEQMLSALLSNIDAKRVAEEGNPQEMARMLVAGSDMSDNATAVVLLFVADGDAAAAEGADIAETLRMNPEDTASISFMP